MSRRRTILALLMGAAVLGVAGLGQWKAVATAPPSQFITVPVRTGPLEHAVLASGVIEPARLVRVGAQVSGQINHLHVAVGDRVAVGDLIAEIDSLPQQKKLENAEAALDYIKAQRESRLASLKQAELAFTRQRTLIKTQAVTPEAYETAEATLNITRADIAALDAQIRQAAIAVDTARLELGYSRISAPIQGVVVAVVAEEGQTVNSMQSAPTIVMIAQLDRMKIKAQISEADVMRVRPGQAVTFTILGEPDRHYQAELTSIRPAPASISATNEAGTGTTTTTTTTAVYYDGILEFPNTDGALRPSMTAEVHIVTGRVENALFIPATALGNPLGADSYSVRVLNAQGQPETRTVETGLNNKVDVQVLTGLHAGEQVVIGDAARAIPGGSSWGWD